MGRVIDKTGGKLEEVRKFAQEIAIVRIILNMFQEDIILQVKN